MGSRLCCACALGYKWGLVIYMQCMLIICRYTVHNSTNVLAVWEMQLIANNTCVLLTVHVYYIYVNVCMIIIIMILILYM